MLQVGRRLDLSQEAFPADDRRQFRLQHFQGDVAVVLQVLGQIHRGHAAFAKLTLDGVAAL